MQTLNVPTHFKRHKMNSVGGAARAFVSFWTAPFRKLMSFASSSTTSTSILLKDRKIVTFNLSKNEIYSAAGTCSSRPRIIIHHSHASADNTTANKRKAATPSNWDYPWESNYRTASGECMTPDVFHYVSRSSKENVQGTVSCPRGSRASPLAGRRVDTPLCRPPPVLYYPHKN
jgi:hypothetical protein